MWEQILPGLRIKLFLTLLLGIVYPLAVTGVSKVAFPHQADGSLLVANGQVIGSELIGQNFTKPKYFQPRPSAAGTDGYDATSSGGSNLGPTSQKLHDRIRASIDKFRKENPYYTGQIPADLVTTSASGLDPHLSPDAALAQVPRIALARAVSADRVRELVNKHTEGPDFGLLGEPRVNVLRLNLALDTALSHGSK